MFQLFAVFFEAIHGAEEVPFAFVSADNSRFFRNVDAADRIAVCILAETALPSGHYWRFAGCCQR